MTCLSWADLAMAFGVFVVVGAVCYVLGYRAACRDWDTLVNCQGSMNKEPKS